MGICESLNDKIKRSCGELIAIQQADYISLPDRIETDAAWFYSYPDIDLVAGWIRYINDRGRQKETTNGLSVSRPFPTTRGLRTPDRLKSYTYVS
jgi:cellulose synthase/poly-beta-1,6-N-acetylglucosamine synthase-like glycosyltransferase